MIQLSEMFSMINGVDCNDVATSLAHMGIAEEISMPIYEIFFLKIVPGANAKDIASNMQEFVALRNIGQACGAVSATINLLDCDMLTLAGLECIYTPYTGMNVFFKLGSIITENISDDMIQGILDIAGVPIPQMIYDMGEFIGDVIEQLVNRLVDTIGEDLSTYGINLASFDQFPDYYNMLLESGEMHEMQKFRMMTGAMTL